MTAHTNEERKLVDAIGDALEKAYPGQVERNATGANVSLVIPTADGTVGTDHNETLSADQAGQLDLKDPKGKKSRNRPGGMNVGRLQSFVARLEKLEEERQAIGGDIKDVYSEAKSVGYDVKTMRKIVQLRKMDAADRAEQETLLDVYKHALGMV